MTVLESVLQGMEQLHAPDETSYDTISLLPAGSRAPEARSNDRRER